MKTTNLNRAASGAATIADGPSQGRAEKKHTGGASENCASIALPPSKNKVPSMYGLAQKKPDERKFGRQLSTNTNEAAG